MKGWKMWHPSKLSQFLELLHTHRFLLLRCMWTARSYGVYVHDNYSRVVRSWFRIKHSLFNTTPYLQSQLKSWNELTQCVNKVCWWGINKRGRYLCLNFLQAYANPFVVFARNSGVRKAAQASRRIGIRRWPWWGAQGSGWSPNAGLQLMELLL